MTIPESPASYKDQLICCIVLEEIGEGEFETGVEVVNDYELSISMTRPSDIPRLGPDRCPG